MKPFSQTHTLSGVFSRSLLILLSFFFSLSMYAQQQDITHFLGIPVDGSKSSMIQKLKAKGFKSFPEFPDVLFGEFNGVSSKIFIVTNKGKVWRIAVSDAHPLDETNIKFRFNSLYRQFLDNPKYLQASASIGNLQIPSDENIGHEIFLNKKRYEANFVQVPSMGSSTFEKDILAIFNSKYTKEQAASMTEKELDDTVKDCANIALETYAVRPVWFIINESDGGFIITLFYDNEYNSGRNGEDL